MGEVVTFSAVAFLTMIIANERIRRQKDKPDQAFDPFYGRLIEAGAKNNLNSFIRLPNRETKLLVS